VAKMSTIIEVFQNLEALSHEAASTFVTLSRNCIASRGRFTVAISGGDTPKRLYTLLGSAQYCNLVDWSNVHFFWVDERCVPKESEESNFKTAFDAFLSKIPLPDKNIHRIKGEEKPEKAAVDYEHDIRRFYKRTGLVVFDLVILGMGGDGHIASLFPGSEALKETRRLAVAVYMKESKKKRITLTLSVLNNAAQILFLVAGQSKADMVLKILGYRDKKQYPASLVSPVHGVLRWLLDKEAASKLN